MSLHVNAINSTAEKRSKRLWDCGNIFVFYWFDNEKKGISSSCRERKNRQSRQWFLWSQIPETAHKMHKKLHNFPIELSGRLKSVYQHAKWLFTGKLETRFSLVALVDCEVIFRTAGKLSWFSNRLRLPHFPSSLSKTIFLFIAK